VDGVLPLAPSMDHVGAMANCVRDLAILFETIAGADGKSSSVQALPAATFQVDRRLSKEFKERPPWFVRLHGLFDELTDPVMAAVIDRLCYDLRSKPDTDTRVTDGIPPAPFHQVIRNHGIIMAVEAAQYHGTRLARHPEDYPPRIRELIETGLRTSAIEYREARLDRDALETQMDEPAVWSGFYLTPATTGPAPAAFSTGNPAYNSPWSYTGLPTVSVPVGFTADGLPLAVQLVSAAEHDGSLLAAAAWVERAIGFERRALPL
jgi:aspartyl-tRNA(Asn)/glutamyl-tRNA(Gln) amidotransferase subunit A